MSDFEINLTDVEELDSSSIGPMPAGDYEMIAQTWEAKKSKATNHRMINIPLKLLVLNTPVEKFGKTLCLKAMVLMYPKARSVIGESPWH